jgi:DNA invertase Pin-like site-specific DNA recombinase
MSILALIAEFENDIRRERQMDGIKKARERSVRFGRKPLILPETVKEIRVPGGWHHGARDHAPNPPQYGQRVQSPCATVSRSK